MRHHEKRPLRARLRTINYYLIVGILMYEGTGLFHEPYTHLLSSHDRVLLERVGQALRGMPETDFYTTSYSYYVPKSQKSALRFALLHRGLLQTEDGEPAELVDPRYLEWEDRLENPGYLEKVKAELEETIQDYLDGARVEIDIHLTTHEGAVHTRAAPEWNGRLHAMFTETTTGETAS